MNQICVKIAGKEYPLLLTVRGMKEIMELVGGGLDKLGDFISGKAEDGTHSIADIMDHTLAVMGVLIEGGELNRRMEAHLSGGDDTPRTIPDRSTLPLIVLPGAIAGYQLAILRAVTVSMAQTVEVDPAKNVESGEPE